MRLREAAVRADDEEGEARLSGRRMRRSVAAARQAEYPLELVLEPE